VLRLIDRPRSAIGRDIATSVFRAHGSYHPRAASDRMRPLQLNETVFVVPRIGVGPMSQHPMSKHATSVIMSAAVSVATFATAHATHDNDSVYVDAKSFQVIPGKGKGDAGPQLRDLAARELGPGAIIIRSGNKLYIAEGQTLRGVVTAYANDPRSVGYNAQFANDPRQYNPALTGGGSIGYNAQFAYDP